MALKEELLKKIADKTLVCGVVGLGYVGLPLAVDKAKHGFKTIGFDVQQQKVDMVNAGQNYIGDVVDAVSYTHLAILAGLPSMCGPELVLAQRHQG